MIQPEAFAFGSLHSYLSFLNIIIVVWLWVIWAPFKESRHALRQLAVLELQLRFAIYFTENISGKMIGNETGKPKEQL